jgi:hypothetical protein
MSNASNTRTYFTYTGAQVRELAAKGDAVAVAELAYRKAKKPDAEKTVAALKSQGLDAAAAAKVAAAKAAKAAAPAKAPAFARTTKVAVVAPTTGRLTLKGMDTRMQSVEQAVIALAGAQQSANEVLAKLAAKLLA